MRRAFEAFRDWLQLRACLREERRRHIGRATADLRALRLSRRPPKRVACARFGHRAHMKLAAAKSARIVSDSCACFAHTGSARPSGCSRSRCSALLLASTEGNMERTLLSAAVTESVCAHGHGLLVETRWERHFQHGEMDFNGLIRVQPVSGRLAGFDISILVEA